jgi:dephospho-CoA kinase
LNKSQVKKQLVIGLTGGPGVGKSEVAKILKAEGVKIISADKIGHDILVNNRVVRRKLINLLGERIVASDDKLDRGIIGALVFGNPLVMYEFNLVVHPPLLRKLKEAIRRERMRDPRLVVVDAALIFEWGIADWFDIILVVQAKRAVRISRMTRQGLSKSRAARRIASQMGQKHKIALADYVIENNSTKLILKKKTLEFYNAIKDIFR